MGKYMPVIVLENLLQKLTNQMHYIKKQGFLQTAKMTVCKGIIFLFLLV